MRLRNQGSESEIRARTSQVKYIISQVIGVDPKVQKLLFRGKEKEDEEYLSMAGIKENSKVILMEETSIEKNSEEAEEKSETSRGVEAVERESEEDSETSRAGEAFEKLNEEVDVKSEASRGCEAVGVVRAEVDKLSDQVDALQVVINGGTKVDEKDIVYLTEMLMRQLLKLDGIDAEGEGKVRRVQRLVDNMDALKGKNLSPSPGDSNPPHLGDNASTVSVKTQWETFDSGVGSLSPPPPPSSPPHPSSTVATHNREEFE
ncbi:unnamed protein product [Cuscuta campestris]|uniref:Ubiquitin-like domain-containing protein n=1 Tax=Cuscuta campestris TaxID=132261 RepID=A0A484MLG2_9ASTE|nr:unnamed protein product [Cuscuta campestris]